MEKRSLAILCPVAESVDPLVFQHTMALVSWASSHDVAVTQVGVTRRTLIHSARNQLASGFLKTDCEWAFWMDADMILPNNTINRLLDVAKDKNALFVTGVYYQRLGDHMPILWKKDPVDMEGNVILSDPKLRRDEKEAYKHNFILPNKNATQPFRADVCGFGCVLMHRKVLEGMVYPYFKTISDDCSEDFYFCINAKKSGFELWADPLLTLGHLGDPPVFTKHNCRVAEDKLKQIKV